jgi:hypothetical protein
MLQLRLLARAADEVLRGALLQDALAVEPACAVIRLTWIVRGGTCFQKLLVA